MAARQAPLSLGLSRQEYWGGLPFHSPGDLPDSGIKPRSPALQADASLSELLCKMEIKNLLRILKEVAVVVTELYLTLCQPMDCGLPGSSVYGILHARILE